MTNPPVCLTIAGSDSGGGAGIQADLKSFQALGIFGTSALTAVTAQNTSGVSAIQGIDPDIVAAQIQVVLEDFPVAAAKTGMLFSADIIEAVQAVLLRYRQKRPLPLVCDPVLVATSGSRLLEESAEAALRRFLPLADIITPNIPEAEALLGRPLAELSELRQGGQELFDTYGAKVLLKGGHLSEFRQPEMVDLFFDGERVHEISGPRLPGSNWHGTGCTLSAAITAGLARGKSDLEAIQAARDYVTGAIRQAPELGQGSKPLNHMWRNFTET